VRNFQQKWGVPMKENIFVVVTVYAFTERTIGHCLGTFRCLNFNFSTNCAIRVVLYPTRILVLSISF